MQINLDGVRADVAKARAFVHDTLAEWGYDSVADDVVLLVSEVVTNAVLHARTGIVVALRHSSGEIRVDVADGSAALPQVRAYDASAATGRGLQLVDRLAKSWGVQPSATGKTVWFAFAGSAAGRDDLGAHDEAPIPDLDALEAAGGWESESPPGPGEASMKAAA